MKYRYTRYTGDDLDGIDLKLAQSGPVLHQKDAGLGWRSSLLRLAKRGQYQDSCQQ